MLPILRGAHKEILMLTITVVILTAAFILGSIGPLLVTEDVQDIVAAEQ